MSETNLSESHLSEFASSIAVQRQSDTAFSAELDGQWSVAGAVNGGYLLSVVAQALRANSENAPDPLVLSTYYLGPSEGGEADITTRLIREGRSSATYAVDLAQEGAAKITALATMGNLARLPDDVATTGYPTGSPGPRAVPQRRRGARRFPEVRSLAQALRDENRPCDRWIRRWQAQRTRCSCKDGFASPMAPSRMRCLCWPFSMLSLQ